MTDQHDRFTASVRQALLEGASLAGAQARARREVARTQAPPLRLRRVRNEGRKLMWDDGTPLDPTIAALQREQTAPPPNPRHAKILEQQRKRLALEERLLAKRGQRLANGRCLAKDQQAQEPPTCRQIMAWRQQAGLSQRALAKLVGAPRSMVGRLEAEGSASLAFRRKCAEAMGKVEGKDW